MVKMSRKIPPTPVVAPWNGSMNDAGVFSRPLQHALAARGQALQVNARRFVGTMLAPHHAENSEFGERGFSSSEKLFDLFVFFGSEAVLPEGFRRKGRSQGSGHGETLLSHLAGPLGRERMTICLNLPFLNFR
jgi:hypothetical protein